MPTENARQYWERVTTEAYERGYRDGSDVCQKLRDALKRIADIAEDPECDDLEEVAIICITIAKNALFFEVVDNHMKRKSP